MKSEYVRKQKGVPQNENFAAPLKKPLDLITVSRCSIFMN